MATSGEAGDEPVPKQTPLPAGPGRVYAAGHHGALGFNSSSYTGVDPEIKSGVYLEIKSGVDPNIQSDVYPKFQSGFDAKIPSSKYAGVGPMIAAGVYLRSAPGSFAGVDLMAVADHFSNLHSMPLAGDTRLDTFRPPVPRTLQLPVVVLSPREYRTVTLFRNYMRKARVLRRENLEALLDKREDRAEKKKLEAERLQFEKEKKEFEEEKMKFEEEKKQFPQKAVVMDDEKNETMPSLIESKIDAADKHINLFEKVINIPKRGEQLGKTISENAEVVAKKLKDNKTVTKIKGFLTATATAGIGIFKEEIKEWTGLGVGDSAGGSNSGESNGVLNEGNSPVPKADTTANGAGNGNGATSFHKAGNGGKGAPSTGVGSAASTGVGSAASTGVGSAASTGVGSASSTGVGSATSSGVGSASSTGVGSASSTGVGSAPATGGATGAPVGAGPKGE